MLADDTAMTIVHQANKILEQKHVMKETYWLIGFQIMDLEMNTVHQKQYVYVNFSINKTIVCIKKN